VLDFVKPHVFDPADFVIRADGVCRLSLETARMVWRGFRLKSKAGIDVNNGRLITFERAESPRRADLSA
jgi:hypothetical protein